MTNTNDAVQAVETAIEIRAREEHPGEPLAKAVARFLDTPAGGRMYALRESIAKLGGTLPRPADPAAAEAFAEGLVAGEARTDRERAGKALVRKQLETGHLTVGQAAAEMVIERRAHEIAKRDGVSYERAYVRAMDEDPETAALAAG